MLVGLNLMIYRSDRTRRKNEALANDIFSRGRRQSAPGAAALRKPGTGPSLASRVGISKVSDIFHAMRSHRRTQGEKVLIVESRNGPAPSHRNP